MFKKLIEESTGKSPWLFHINAGSCNGCDIELVSVLTPRYDAERLGFKLTGNVFKGSYSVAGPLSKYVHVDVDVAGCAPKPEAVIDGLALAAKILQEKRGKM